MSQGTAKRKREGTASPSNIGRSPPIPAPKPKDDAMNRIARDFYLRANYSDMTIICGDEVIHAHKLVVCPQSRYFEKACNGSFKEANEPIRFPDKEPALVKKVLEYLYTGDYPLDFKKPVICGSGTGKTPDSDQIKKDQSAVVTHPASSETEPGSQSNTPISKGPSVQLQHESSPSSSEITSGTTIRRASDEFTARCLANPAYFHARVYAEADYFLIEELKQKAWRVFYTVLCEELKKETLEETLKEIYSGRANYSDLKRFAVRPIVAHLRNPADGNVPLWSIKFIESMPEFAIDLSTIEKVTKHICP